MNGMIAGRGAENGDDMMRDCLRELYVRHHAFVRRLCGRYVQNPADADDLAHDVLVKAARAWRGFGGGCAVTSWLYRVATNLCRDHLRRRTARERVLAHPAVAEGWTWRADAPERFEERDPVAAAVLGALREELQGTERHLVYLRFDVGMPQHGIVRVTGLPRAAVRRRLTRIAARAATLYERLERGEPVGYGPAGRDGLRS